MKPFVEVMLTASAALRTTKPNEIPKKAHKYKLAPLLPGFGQVLVEYIELPPCFTWWRVSKRPRVGVK